MLVPECISLVGETSWLHISSYCSVFPDTHSENSISEITRHVGHFRQIGTMSARCVQLILVASVFAWLETGDLRLYWIQWYCGTIYLMIAFNTVALFDHCFGDYFWRLNSLRCCWYAAFLTIVFDAIVFYTMVLKITLSARMSFMSYFDDYNLIMRWYIHLIMDFMQLFWPLHWKWWFFMPLFSRLRSS